MLKSMWILFHMCILIWFSNLPSLGPSTSEREIIVFWIATCLLPTRAICLIYDMKFLGRKITGLSLSEAFVCYEIYKYM